MLNTYIYEDPPNTFETKACEAIYSVLQRPFDLDFATMENMFWYEIHPEHNEFTPIEPNGTYVESIRVLEALKPIFAEINATELDDAVGQDLFLSYNWLRVVGMVPES